MFQAHRLTNNACIKGLGGLSPLLNLSNTGLTTEKLTAGDFNCSYVRDVSIKVVISRRTRWMRGKTGSRMIELNVWDWEEVEEERNGSSSSSSWCNGASKKEVGWLLSLDCE